MGLFVSVSLIVFCRAVGHFLKFLFLLRLLCKLFDKALVGALAREALAMCLQIGLILHFDCFIVNISRFTPLI